MTPKSLLLLGTLGLAGIALHLFNMGDGVSHPLPGWIAESVLFCAWLVAAAPSRPSGRGDYGVVALTGLLVAFGPITGLLPTNRCLIFGPCVF